jgi:hypothetical protein
LIFLPLLNLEVSNLTAAVVILTLKFKAIREEAIVNSEKGSLLYLCHCFKNKKTPRSPMAAKLSETKAFEVGNVPRYLSPHSVPCCAVSDGSDCASDRVTECW